MTRQRLLGPGFAVLAATIAFAMMVTVSAAVAQDVCRLEFAPKEVQVSRNGAAAFVAMTARPPAQAVMQNARLTLQAPAGVTATIVGPAPSFPMAGDSIWNVKVELNDTAPAKGEILVDMLCETRMQGESKAAVIRHAIAALPLTARSATQAFGKLKMHADPPADPVSELRPGTLNLTVENQGDQDLLDASVTVTAPAFMQVDPAVVALGRLGAGTTRTLPFKLTQTGRAESGAPAPVLSLRARAAGETTIGMITITTPVALSVLGLSDALKLLQIPSFILLPGALLLLACDLIWRLRNNPGDFPLAWTKPQFWLAAITLSIVIALLYPVVTGWFGPAREYLTAFTLLDVMLVWFSSIILALPAYALSAVAGIRWTAYRVRVEEQTRQQRDVQQTDDPITLLRKLNAKGLPGTGQTFPAVAIERDGQSQTVLQSQTLEGDHCWVLPRAEINLSRMDPDLNWTVVDATLQSANDAAGIPALLDLFARHHGTLSAVWIPGDLIGRPTLWPTTDLHPLNESLPLFDR